MMGVNDRPLMRDNKIIPLEAHGVKVMSIGFIMDPDKALIWRGPLVAQLITQFLNDVTWGDLDYLLFDMPPGTGDIAISLAQLVPSSELLQLDQKLSRIERPLIQVVSDQPAHQELALCGGERIGEIAARHVEQRLAAEF